MQKNKILKREKKTKIELSTKEPELTQVEAQYKEILWSLPNPAAADVPVGEDESSNKVIRSWGTIPHFDFPVKDHIELGEDLDIIDVKKASDVSGARFAYLKGDAALLEFALVSFAFSVLTNEETLAKIAKEANLDVSTKPFVPVVPPVMIKPDVFDRMARLKPEEERYHFPTDDMYLVGSAEHTLGALHIDEMLPEKEFPKRYVGFSTSFRREAGSYGRDTKGILRVHQFDKVEIESFTTADQGAIEQEFIVEIQEYLMRELGLAYEVMAVCTGDMGGPDFRQVDINTWIPSQDKYRETHSSDYNTDYQARRLNTRVKRVNNDVEFVHMNDATVFAIGRTLIAILENNQQPDGTVLIPQVLQKWIGKDRIVKRS
jgi:seryl-tRNA synthetase